MTPLGTAAAYGVAPSLHAPSARPHSAGASFIGNVSVALDPRAIVYDSGKGELFVADYRFNTGGFQNGSVSVVSAVTHRVLATIPLAGNPWGPMTYDPANGEIFAVLDDQNISVISDATNTVIGYIAGPYSGGITYDNGTGELFVSGGPGTGNVTVLSGTTHAVVTRIPMWGPTSLEYDPGTGSIYAASPYDNITVISDSTDQVVGEIPLGSGNRPSEMAYDAARHEVLVGIDPTCPAPPACPLGSLTIIADSNRTVVSRVPAGEVPWGVAYDNRTGEIIVVNSNDTCTGGYSYFCPNSGNLTIISDTTDRATGSVSPLDFEPESIAFDPQRGAMYVTEFTSSNVTIVNDGTGAQPVVPTSVSIAPSPANVAVGGSLSLMASVTCDRTCPGSGISYAWQLHLKSGNLSGISGPSIVYRAGPSVATGSVEVTATLNGVSRSANDSITVTPTPLGAEGWANVTGSGGGGECCVGSWGSVGSHPAWENVSFQARAWNGTPPYTYSWIFGDGTAGATGSRSNYTYGGYGNWMATLTVTDALGQSNHTESSVIFIPPPGATPYCPSGVLGLPAWEGYSLVAGVGAGIMAAGIALYLRRGRSPGAGA